MGNVIASVKSELKIRYFGFADCEPEKFYKSPWFKNPWILFNIKLFFSLFWLAFIIAEVVVRDSLTNWWIYLTNWGQGLLQLYFFLSMSVVGYGMYSRSTHVSHENESSTSSRPKLRWFHKIVWILHEVSVGFSIIVTIAFWTLLSQRIHLTIFSFNAHLFNTILMVTDLFLCEIPFRILHFYHSVLAAIVYTFFTLVLHWSGYVSEIYPGVFDWANRPLATLAFCLVMTAVVTPLGHVIFGFGLFKLRLFIVEKVIKAPESSSNEPSNTGNQSV